MQAIILAGGLGTRLQSVVSDRPKPMAPVNGRPFLEHLMDYWIAQGVTSIVLAIGYKHEVVTEHFGGTYKGTPIRYTIESKPLGSGGGLLLGLTKIDPNHPCLVLNADTMFKVKLSSLASFHQSHEARFTMVVRHIENNTRYGGVTLNSDNQISAFGEESFISNSLINGGIYLLEPTLFDNNSLPTTAISLENDIMPGLFKESANRCFGFISDANFIDIGIPADYERAVEHVD